MQQRLGRRTRLAAPTSPPTQWSSAPWRCLRRPTLFGPVTALGAGHDFLNGRSGRVVGEGRLHHGSSGAPVTYGWLERLFGEGVRPHQRVCGAITRDEEQRQHLLQVVERHRALYPCAK
ncbi:hypothetical protein GWK47_039581 [Chionoecetes opilio]|uniref:Uncharacterized protein n=1 Tax=Chionoecetes opilio TaxID=41210 RepID=A0A8J4YJ75_CHIOP|nr:hypothetical protein GWK47_039581 [Chionoecetes opilio]